jgi:stage III sporulation protein AG
MKLTNLPEPLKKYGALGLVVLAGLLLLLWPRGMDPPAQDAPPQAAGEMFDLAAMEQRLGQTLSSIEGAGEVNVLLTLKTDMEVVVVQDADVRTRQNTEDGEVTSRDDERHDKTVLAGGVPIVRKRVYPVYLGALIVCEGAGEASVHAAILEAVSALTGLRADSITVAKAANH